MFKLLSKLYMWAVGWSMTKGLPKDLKKCVIIAAPHTSNQDFYLTRAAFFILDAPINFVIKKEIMIFPLSIILKALGALPVNRKKKENFTDAMVRLIETSPKINFLIAPEGSRKAVEKWKTGFYYIAVQAKVPIVLGFLDYKKKLAGFGPIYYPTGDKEQDFNFIRGFYETITPKYPDQYKVNLY